MSKFILNVHYPRKVFSIKFSEKKATVETLQKIADALDMKLVIKMQAKRS